MKPINRGRNVVLAAMSNLLVDDDQEEQPSTTTSKEAKVEDDGEFLRRKIIEFDSSDGPFLPNNSPSPFKP